jgi:hypothetical protein
MGSQCSVGTEHSRSSPDRSVEWPRRRSCRLCKRRTCARRRRGRRASLRSQRRRRTDRKPSRRISAPRRGIRRCTESRSGLRGTRWRWSSRRRRRTRRNGGGRGRSADIRAPYSGRPSRTRRIGLRCSAAMAEHNRHPACTLRARRSGCRRDTRRLRLPPRSSRGSGRASSPARGRHSRRRSAGELSRLGPGEAVRISPEIVCRDARSRRTIDDGQDVHLLHHGALDERAVRVRRDEVSE